MTLDELVAAIPEETHTGRALLACLGAIESERRVRQESRELKLDRGQLLEQRKLAKKLGETGAPYADRAAKMVVTLEAEIAERKRDIADLRQECDEYLAAARAAMGSAIAEEPDLVARLLSMSAEISTSLWDVIHGLLATESGSR